MARYVWLKKLLLGIAGSRALKKLDHKSKNCKKAQQECLRSILSWARDTHYGKNHHFESITSIAQYQQAVPVQDYEALRPYIDRHTRGEADVLVPGKPLFYATTSGTTKSPKWIPITRRYYQQAYKQLSVIWLYTCVKANPTIFDGYDLSIVSPAVEGYAPDGSSYGSLSGHQYSNIPGFMKDIHCIPYSTICIEDYEAKYYCLVRMTVEKNITYAIMANPSSLIQLNRRMNENAADIINDIEQGTLSDKFSIPAPARRDLEALLKPNPKRARELRTILKRHGELLPRYIWPNLALLNTWKCGNSGLYLRHAEPTLPQKTVIREFAYQATECRSGIVLSNNDLGTVLCGHIHFFEFIKLEDLDQENPRIYCAWELENKKRYKILITATNGMYRYDINDIIEVDGFYNEFPKLKFVEKCVGITSLTGEKLHEAQLIEAVKEAGSSLGVTLNFFIAFGHFDSSRYHLYAEISQELTSVERKKFSNQVDENLMSYNDEYKQKRKTDRLGPVELKILTTNTYDKYKVRKVKEGGRDGQFKLVHLLIDDRKKKEFDSLVV